MKPHYKILGTFMIAATASAISCTDLSELEDRVDSLESRVTALESQIESLNSNIASLNTFVENHKTISSVEYNEDTNTWTLTLSDNTKITIHQGSDGNTPIISLDEDNYWMVDYGDGNGSQYLYVNGEKVQAGTVPVFGIDNEGYWTVSYDGGVTVVYIYDSEGSKVSALSTSSGSFFSDVSYDESAGTFTVTLTDGNSYSLTVVKDFICAINGVDYSVAEVFEYGETKTYDMTVTGVSYLMTYQPDGWTVTISENGGSYTLSVMAPSTASLSGISLLSTIIADSRTDVTVLALSANGYATMAKMQVELSDESVPATAMVTAVSGAETATSLTFTVTPDSRTTSWSYILQPSSETAPTSSSGNWTVGSSTSLTFTELDGGTSYTLYVLPYRDSEPGTIASASATTLRDYYTDYINGKDITVGDRTYNISTYGDPTLIRSGETMSSLTTKVNFIEDNSTISTGTSVNDHVFIGRYENARSEVTFANWLRLAPTDGTDGFVLYNLDISHDSFTAAAYYSALSANGTFEYICIDDCKVDLSKNLFGITNTDRYVTEIVIKDSDFAVPVASSDTYILGTNGSSFTITSATIENNLFYGTTEGNAYFRLVGLTGADVTTLSLNNNTFCNLEGPSNTDFYINLNSIETLNAQYNVFYNTVNTHGKNYSAIRCVSTYPTAGAANNNIAYTTTSYSATLFYNNSYNESFVNVEQLSESPFSVTNFDYGIFTTNSSYSGYGAQRD